MTKADETNADDEAPIRILHLSDIHFKASKSWDQDPVLRALAGFIGEEVERDGPPDLVAITGDIAHAGIAEEYALACDWLNTRLWPKLGALPRDRLLLVPGNHDVDRNKVGTGVRNIQAGLLRAGAQNEIAALLGDEDERRIMLKRHAAYMDFVADWLGAPQPLPWWQRVIEIRKTKLHVAGLDSAWMAWGDEDRGRLLLGRWQVNQTVNTADAAGTDWRLALLHHPWDYLAEFDHHEARAAVHLHRDLLLRGHLHRPAPERIRSPDPGRGCLELPTGCVYESSGYPNAYQWIELSPTGRRVRVLFRAWVQGAWTIDRNQPNCPDGHWEVDLAAAPAPAPIAHKPAAPELPPEYLDWLQRTCADVSLLGQERQQGQALTLNHVYVPALTAPTAEPAAPPVRKQPWEIQREEHLRSRPIPLLQRLDAESLYVPAPAGAGKSTFCRWAALRSIAGADIAHPVPAPAEFAEPPPTNLRGRLPLLVPLRDFHEGIDCGRGRRTSNRRQLEEALAAWVDRSLPDESLTGALLLAHLRAGSAFLLLDGLDEVPVSDTRDGATVYPRDLLLSGLADALPVWLKAGNRVLLTSRPYGLDGDGLRRLGLPQAPLDPLPEPLQDLFVARWFHALGKPQQTQGLIATIREREFLAPLVKNPMLLTALCVLYDSGGRLPEDRYELYRRIVNNVLFHRFRDEVQQREPARARLEAIAHGMHVGDREAPRESPAAEISHLEIDQLLRAFAADDPYNERGRIGPVAQREELLTRSGLLLPRPGDRAAFYHLSVQEFLAAERILRTEDDLFTVFRARSAVAGWRPTLMFLFAGKIAGKTPRWGTDLLARLIDEQGRTAVKANPAPAVFIAEALDLCLAKNYAVAEELKEAFRRLALDAIEDEVELQARQALGLTLGRVGDPRIVELRDPGGYVEVPAGTYPYGDEGQTVEITAPFRIGRYPVTNQQYAAFLAAEGCADRRWWSKEGWSWLKEEKATAPTYWHDRHWNAPNQPVVGVSFWEAEACCAWAGGRLPTEKEWEAAARGPRGLAYPWGNNWQDGVCNTYEAGLGVTSPVGLFPRARQADLAIEDLAGNVWDWCNSLHDPADKEELQAPRVLRGGSWYLNQVNARSADRNRNNPDYRNLSVGFRVVCLSHVFLFLPGPGSFMRPAGAASSRCGLVVLPVLSADHGLRAEVRKGRWRGRVPSARLCRARPSGA